MQDEKDILKNDRDDEESEIDIVELAAKIWKQRRTVFIWSGIAAVIGLVVAFSIPREYTTTIKLAPELTNNSGKLGSLGGLAAMAGINIQNQSGGDAVGPQLYPEVLSSVPFNVALFDVKVKEDKTDSVYTVREYIEEHTSGPWWGAIFKLPGQAIGAVKSLIVDEEEDEDGHVTDAFRLTQDEDRVYKALGERISADYDTKTFVNTISVTMQDPLVSAMLADTVAANLQNYIIEYRTAKARKDMEYARQLNDKAREEYYAAQQRLAEYLDRNQGMALHSAQVTRERLENEVQLAFSLFNQTAQQLQMAEAKVQEAAPVYTAIEPASVPRLPSKPSKVLILIGWIFLGAVAACAWILYGDTVKQIKSKVTE